MDRHCYCGLWRTSPETLEKQGLPRGFCGMCTVCGKPGHTRHFPGPVPMTLAWCDKHYFITKWRYRFTSPLFWIGVGLVVIVVLERRCT